MNFRKLLILVVILTSTFAFSQKGVITGKILDGEDSNAPLPFANVFIKGTEIGSTTDFDGIYTISAEPGTYTLVLSFIGYTNVEVPNVIVNAGEAVTLEDIVLSASEGVALDEIVIIAETKRESVQSLLTDQKKAVEVKSSIGSAELSEKSISDAAGAVAVISGVSKEEGSSNVYVRGLGDRYLNTTLNELSLPSNDVNKKNIDLDLFSTDIIENVSISKSFAPRFYADFSAGNVDISSKKFTSDKLIEGSIGTSINTNAIGQSTFYKSEGTGDFGFYNRYNHNPYAVVLSHGVDPTSAGAPIGYSVSAALGKSFDIGEESRLSLYLSGSFENDYSFQEGSEIDYSNAYNKRFPNVEKYKYTTNTTLLGTAIYKFNPNHKLSYNSLFINSSGDEVGFYGTQGNGFLRDSRSLVDTDRGFFQMNVQFNQDLIFVNQLLGEHTLNEKIKLDWGVGYNNVYSHEPDRKRISLEDYFYALDDDPTTNPVFLTNNSFDNQRYFQKIVDEELNGRIKMTYEFSENAKMNIGYNGRLKKRDFENVRYGYKNFDDSLIADPNNFNNVFNVQNVIDSLIQTDVFRALAPENGVGPTNRPGQLENTYQGRLETNGGFVSFEFNLDDNKWLISPGIRAESFLQKIEWDAINLVNNPGTIQVVEDLYLPNLNIRYALNEDQNLRVSASKTVSTPEFKETSPHVYEDVTQKIGGNPDLLGHADGITYNNVKDVSYSDILNIDIKYEWFMGKGQVVSLAGFTKQINDPVNLVVANDATGTQRYFRTGEKATVYGIEFEFRKHLLLDEEENGKLTLGLNASYMDTEQDLYSSIAGSFSTSFDRTKDDLQGASPFIGNTSLTYKSNLTQNIASTFNVVGNYYSDRIFALGSGQLGNRIEKGYVTLDFVWKNELSENMELNFSAKNILNPDIQVTREVSPTEEILLEDYKKGANLSLGFKYKF
ncbi:TonB-dependent receptor [Urechidicola croceus]|uniref:TonB-dependent receptor n=1 Tax=Urechidicola croceus TaxID=1850246 RepID=A0A1D8P8V4_9FLAO|nr:TonB-dependent receptor [Urechidicola croceus]AOW21011.1 TonB-dependent receptor [Urechidicola croceus]